MQTRKMRLELKYFLSYIHGLFVLREVGTWRVEQKSTKFLQKKMSYGLNLTHKNNFHLQE